MLSVRNVVKSFGALKALNDISLDVKEDLVTGLIGPNGSGKTTLFHSISGFYRVDSGEIFLRGDKISGLEPHIIANLGLMRNFQICKAPEKLTVFQNLLMASTQQKGERVWQNFIYPSLVKREEEKNMKRAINILDLVQLTHLKNEYAGNLSGGQKKLLSLGRMLMAEPAMLLLDEPTAGVNLTLVKNLLTVIKEIKKVLGITFLIIEHNMTVINDLCDHVFVLDSGRVIAEGTPSAIKENERVLEAYLSRGDSGKNQSDTIEG